MRSDPGNLHAPGGQFHDHEYIVGYQAMPGHHLHREEVRGNQHLPVQLQELRPTHPSPAALRRWFKMMATQDIAHSQLVNAMSEVR